MTTVTFEKKKNDIKKTKTKTPGPKKKSIKKSKGQGGKH